MNLTVVFLHKELELGNFMMDCQVYLCSSTANGFIYQRQYVITCKYKQISNETIAVKECSMNTHYQWQLKMCEAHIRFTTLKNPIAVKSSPIKTFCYSICFIFSWMHRNNVFVTAF